MYIVTNRQLNERKRGFNIFGKKPNEKGPNELRLVEVTGSQGNRKISVIKEVEGAKEVPSKAIARRVFQQLSAKARQGESRIRNLLIFVHGFNNDVEDVVERAFQLQNTYGIEVLPFAWPANGGGKISGTASYKSDKRDARASIGAFDRVLEKLRDYLIELRGEAAEKARAEATRAHPDDGARRDELFAELLEEQCPVRINLMCHSMGNYLFKNLLQSSIYHGDELLFDNVVLVAADANNEGHAEWVDRIQFRNRVYITINEDDHALKVSRMKMGSAQRARLGHFPYDLNSSRAVYVNFTGARHVEGSHSYFGEDALKNSSVKSFFQTALNGGTAETDLAFDPATNLHWIE